MKVSVLMITAVLTGAASYMTAVAEPALELDREDILLIKRAAGRERVIEDRSAVMVDGILPSAFADSTGDLTEPDPDGEVDPCPAPDEAPTLITDGRSQIIAS